MKERLRRKKVGAHQKQSNHSLGKLICQEKDGSVSYFHSFSIEGERYSVGDCVLLNNPDPEGLPFVGDIMDIFLRKDDEEREALMTVKWYYRACDTAMGSAQLKMHDPQEVTISIAFSR